MFKAILGFVISISCILLGYFAAEGWIVQKVAAEEKTFYEHDTPDKADFFDKLHARRQYETFLVPFSVITCGTIGIAVSAHLNRKK